MMIMMIMMMLIIARSWYRVKSDATTKTPLYVKRPYLIQPGKLGA